jgi:hypothetical protein
MTPTLPTPITEYVEASNTFDGDRLIAAFADDALVNDARREFRGAEAIKAWADQEIIGDKVTMDVNAVREHYGDFIVDAVVDGNFDKSKLPAVIVLTHYFTVRDNKIVSLIILNNPVEP